MENSKKRLREHSSVSSERMAILEDLAHESEEVRVRAAARLLRRMDDPNSGEDVDQLLSRLFRGLCSPRKAARLGFSIALTEALSQHANARAAQVIELLDQNDQVQGKAKVEIRNELLGKVFGAEAIIQSDILFQEKDNQSHWKRLLTILFSLASKKPWIREECCWVSLIGLKRLGKNELGGEWAQPLLELLVKYGLAETPEGIALWTEAVRVFPSVQKPKNIFEKDDPLSKKNWKSLSRILKEQDVQKDPEAENKQSNRSTWSARPNFAWDIIFGALSEDRFARFWREIVDEGLFASSSSSERKHWGLSLFDQMIASCPIERIPDLFSTNLCKCMGNHIAGKDRTLHAAAERALKAALNRAEDTPDASGPIVVRVLQRDVNAIFIRGPLRNKLVDRLLALTSLSSAEKVARSILPLSPEDSKTASQRPDRLSLDLLNSMIRLRPYPTSKSKEIGETRALYRTILSALVRQAYCQPSDTSNDASEDAGQSKNSQSLRQFQQERIWTFLTTLSTREPDPYLYPQTVVQTVAKYEKETGRYPIPGEAAASAIKKAHRFIGRLDASKASKEAEEGAVRLLLSACLLQVYNGDAEALGTLDDLLRCQDDLSADAEQEQKTRASEAMIEVLLSFVSRPPALLKTIALEAFSMCTELLTDMSLQSMLAVLETEESLSGQREMFDTIDSEQSSQAGDQDGDEDEEDSDVEMVDAGEDDGESSESSADTDDESSADEKADAELTEFDAKLAEALGTRRADDDLAHKEDESSESDMDDEQMEALDGHLSLMFKMRRAAESSNKKKDHKNAKETIINFKSRVLELLERLVVKRYQTPLALDVLPVVLKLIRTTNDKTLAAKATRLIQDFSKLVKLNIQGEAGDGPKARTARETSREMARKSKTLLDSVHEAAFQQGSNQYQAACSTASLLLTKSYLSNGGDLEDVFERYNKTDYAWVTSKNSGTKRLFFDAWNEWKAQARVMLAK